MNRSERRRKDREEAKKNNTIKNLDAAQRELISKMGQDLANKYIEKFLNTLDRNLTAAVILSGGSLRTAEKFTLLAGELMGEDTFKVDEFESEFKNEEECQMAANKMYEEIEKEVQSILKEGITKKEAIERLVFKFPKASKSMLTNVYQKVKEKMNKEDPEVKKAVEYIFEGENPKENKEEVKEMKSKGVVANNATTESKLKVLEEKVIKTIKVEGENGVYEGKTGEGLVLTKDNATLTFNTVEELEEWTKEFKEVFAMIKA